MSQLDTVHDRLDAIARLDRTQLALALSLQPHVAAWCVGTGPLRHLIGAGKNTARSAGAGAGRRRLAEVLADRTTIGLTLDLLEPAALQLVMVATGFGGRIRAGQISRELAPLSPAERERLIETLVDRMVALPLEDAGGDLVLRAGVADLIVRPGRQLDRLVLDQTISSDHIASWLRRLGAHPIPPKKGDRIETYRQLITTPESLQAIIDSLTTAQYEILTRLVAAGGHGMSSDRLGVNIWQLRARVLDSRYEPPPAIGPTGTLQSLCDIGLVWVEAHHHQVGLWLEVIVTINGRTFAAWPVAAPTEPVALHHDGLSVPACLSTLHGLLRQVRTEPLPGLKSGGLGVKAIRDLAKRLGRPDAATGVLIHLSCGLGLLEQVSELIGKGRSTDWTTTYEVDPKEVVRWSARGAADQWASLVAAWLDGADLSPDQFVVGSVVRRQLLADLAALEPRHGIARDHLSAWFAQIHHLGAGVDVAELSAQLAALDLIPPSGPVGLTPLARTLLSDAGALPALLPRQDTTFVVQADLTIVAPPALDPAVRSRLDRVCTVESSGSVTVLRLDRGRIAGEFAIGDTADELLTFLTAHSSVPVAPVVAQVLRDVERARGGLRARSAATVITADDVLGLAAAVKVRSAQLTLIAPTVAVSDLPLAKVMAALRAKGLAPSGPSLGQPGGGERHADRTVHRTPKRRLAPVPDILHPQHRQLEQIVESW